MRKKFNASVRRKLAERAGQHCANPTCGRATSGPSHDGLGGSTVLGRACHITAASTTGPRYDSTLTEEQRFHPDNGIWLCAICADKVDKNENESAFPIELLHIWKEFHESLMGTDHASVENRRIYPLRQLTIVDFAGARGEACLTFGALTLFSGTTKLSHTIGELLHMFSDRGEFERACQPASGTTWEYDGPASLNENECAITIAFDPPRIFKARGKLRLQKSDGLEFIITTQRSGATFSVGDTPIPVFSPVIRALALGKRLKNYSLTSKADSEDVEEDLASYFGMSRLEFKACIDGVPTDESVFGYDYKFDTSGSLRVLRPQAEKYQSVNSLSGGEQWRLIVDVATRVAKHAARVGPIVLLLDQSKIRMDPAGWSWLFEWIKNKTPPFQTVADLCYAPSKEDLAGALCYKAKGDDMEVTAFEVMTSI